MAAGKAAIAEAPIPTFPTLDTVIAFLSHFVSQTKTWAMVSLVQGVEVDVDAEGILAVVAAEDADAAEVVEAVGVEVGLS